ncbi:uncharacterized protein LOC142978763 [Anticarsia gemmatalis]|uniref:uncharacterized protein LOC142978763 n=1 Tax=Anticarsia gemmatalis TaxID=129554 RepID=UPI003F772799
MKYPALRQYMKAIKNLSESHTLDKDSKLVIDAQSYFKNSYKESGCQSTLGTDCDKYADYLIKKLSCLKAHNIECMVIFSGATQKDMQNIEETYQTIIDKRKSIEQNKRNPPHFEPLFVKDVQKQVLDEMNIKYFCSEYDSADAIVSVAKTYKCPVLTDNIEYCLFGVSCISLSLKPEGNMLHCTIYNHDNYRTSFGVYNKMPVLLTVLNEAMDLSDAVPVLSHNIDATDIRSVTRWVKQNKNAIKIIADKMCDEIKRKEFLELHEKIKILYLYPSCNLAVKYFQRDKPYGLFKDDKKWFSRGVANGRIAVPYINMKRKGFITGSTLVNDSSQPDAMRAAADIIAYSHCLLTNSQKSVLTLIGKKNFVCEIATRELSKTFTREISNRGIFTKHGKLKNRLDVNLAENPFRLFFKELWPGHSPLILDVKLVPADCWVLVITLAYYVHKINREFKDAAYYILLSYLMLGPISKRLDMEKYSLLRLESTKEFRDMYNGLQFLFKKVDLVNNYNVEFLHSLAEFQHCLQHMNYLNKLCGETLNTTDIPCTVYHDTFNATFVYNTSLFMKNKEKLMEYLESNFQGSKPLKLYKDIVNGFEKYLSGNHVY